MATYPTKATAEMPMPGGLTQLRLIKCLECQDSLYELSQELPRLAAELRSASGRPISTTKTSEAIEGDHLNGWEMVILLLSMSRRAIKSIIYGTVAYDGNLPSRWYDEPTSSVAIPGVYVIGLTRRRCDCKFLNEEELELLIGGLERYVRGYGVITGAPSRAQMTIIQQAEVRWVRNVDDAYAEPGHQSNGSSAFFLGRTGDVALVLELIESLKRRITGLDGTKKIRHIQSPLYVGCSNNLRQRLATYKRNLRTANRPLYLTVSVLKALGLEVVVVPRVVMRTWKAEQLSLGERLVTTLAGSLITQYGFNATQAGANTGDGIGQGNLIWGPIEREGFLVSNLQSMEAEMSRREEFLADLSGFNTSLDNAVAISRECEVIRTHLDVSRLSTPLQILRALNECKLKLQYEQERLKKKNEILSAITGILEAVYSI
ncbi:hypothetical protein FZEAL_4868 [Fusarium zealandicum]|uniref:Uncharacterized protein n=1 Tax=Fusarium zealandicum TaxID=1053134 RepID=A0A8H4ULL8_9HYPO|nr:hypothetical protein FZEAL_4868 [Fusarium zealandicum]